MFRPDKDDLNAFTVVDQVELSIDEAGQYTVDIENTPNPQWAGKVTHTSDSINKDRLLSQLFGKTWLLQLVNLPSRIVKKENQIVVL